jgi:hypothetical protein
VVYKRNPEGIPQYICFVVKNAELGFLANAAYPIEEIECIITVFQVMMHQASYVATITKADWEALKEQAKEDE